MSRLVHTLFAVIRKAIPMGIKPTPMAKSSGNTVPAVNIGCQAGNFCCLNFVSKAQQTDCLSQGFTVTFHSTQKVGNFKDILPSQTLSTISKKLNLT